MFLTLITRLQTRLNEDRGAGMAEYALLLALIGAIVAGAATTLQGSITGVFSGVTTTLN